MSRTDDAVLDAAAHLFRRNGFEGTTVRAIAAHAGMLPGSLHYRYPSKHELLLELMRRAVDRAEQAIGGAIACASHPLERLRAALGMHLELLLSGDDSIYVLLYDWRSLRGRARTGMIALRDRYERVWANLLADASEAGCFRPGLDVKLARLLGFGAVNWVAQWYSPSGERSPQQIADFCWDVICFGIMDEVSRPPHAGAAQRTARLTEGRATADAGSSGDPSWNSQEP